MNDGKPVTNNRVLVIDDNRSIHEDIRKILGPRAGQNASLADAKALLFGDAPSSSSQAEFMIDSAYQGEEGLVKVKAALESGNPYALAFVDVRMPPGWDGIETITRIWKDYPEIQVVICTAYADYSWQEMINQLGRSDSLVILKKPFDNIEVLQLAHALTQKWALAEQVRTRLNDLDQLVCQRTTELQSANERLKQEIAERLLVEQALRLSEERFSKAFKASPIPLAIQSLREEKFVDANEGFQRMTGFDREELMGSTPDALKLWLDPNGSQTLLRKLRAEMAVRDLRCSLRTKAGQVRDILLSVELLELDSEPFMLTIAQDITEQIRLENQLRQSQKMEAIGQLAAGVAHDFNNLLTVIQGHASLLLVAKPEPSAERKPLQTIAAAAERASKLVRQLLTFSRKQFMQAHPMEIRETFQAISEMLPRVIGEDIVVEVSAAPGLPLINADSAMMEQMLMNLAVNARDAMTGGGRLGIKAEAITVSPEMARENGEGRAGYYVCISVSDSGCGIPPENLSRIFEPFFTTKPVGKGTGLGLATVYGIAKQHQGWVEVQSEIGKGSTFKVFLPVCEAGSVAGPAPVTPSPLKGGKETILVVEDEADVRDFVVEVLRSYGYQVLSAVSGQQAQEHWSQRKGEIDLLLTDIVMPGGLTGRQLGEQFLADKPNLPVIYTSGYSPGMAGRDVALLDGDNFLAKPYGPAKLLQAVRDCLERTPPGRGSQVAA